MPTADDPLLASGMRFAEAMAAALGPLLPPTFRLTAVPGGGPALAVWVGSEWAGTATASTPEEWTEDVESVALYLAMGVADMVARETTDEWLEDAVREGDVLYVEVWARRVGRRGRATIVLDDRVVPPPP